MANSTDGVKINIKKEEKKEAEAVIEKDSDVKKELKEEVKKSVPKKKVLKKRIVKKRIVKKKEEPKKIEKKKSKKKGILTVLLNILLTAAIVGGGVFAWQNKVRQKDVAKIEGESNSVKEDFEKRLANLKSKMTGVETSNVELKKTLEEFKKKAELLIGSKKEYKIDDFNLSFEYPASFGNVIVATSTKESSTVLKLNFSDNGKLVIFGVNDEYQNDSTSSLLMLYEIKGFEERKDKYYLKSSREGEEFEVNPAQIIEYSGGKALLIDKNSFVLNEDSDGVPVDIGDNVAFIFDLEDSSYPGFAILNSDFSMMPLNDFVMMVESFKVK
jgi:hypothetical protein